jgi:hypothetical protein
MAKRTLIFDTKELELLADLLDANHKDEKLSKKLRNACKTIKHRSAKNKGASFQKEVAELISNLIGIPLEKDGLIESRGMGQPGVDISLRGEARKQFPWSVECKNQENINLVSYIDQAKSNMLPDTSWLLCIRKKVLKEDIVVMEMEKFFAIMKALRSRV